MADYVVDASVAVSLVLRDEPFHQHATALFERFARRELELVTVPLLIFEVANALWKAVRIGRIDFRDAREALRRIEELRIPPQNVPATEILELAHKHGRTAYDAAYLALACRERVPLVTADRRMCNALEGKFKGIVWIESA
jgi:predicted nucleic acid-binding protein